VGLFNDSIQKEQALVHRPYKAIITILVGIISIAVFIISIKHTGEPSGVEAASYYGSDQVIVEVNQERERKGIEPLLVNTKLMIAAQEKADHMAEFSYFSHIHSDTEKRWLDFIIETDYDYLEAGENLANGYSTVDDMVKAWMNSPAHKENILNEGYFETGVGYAKGKLNGKDTIFVAQMFGRSTYKLESIITIEPINETDITEYEDMSIMDLWQKQEANSE